MAIFDKSLSEKMNPSFNPVTESHVTARHPRDVVVKNIDDTMAGIDALIDKKEWPTRLKRIKGKEKHVPYQQLYMKKETAEGVKYMLYLKYGKSRVENAFGPNENGEMSTFLEFDDLRTMKDHLASIREHIENGALDKELEEMKKQLTSKLKRNKDTGIDTSRRAA